MRGRDYVWSVAVNVGCPRDHREGSNVEGGEGMVFVLCMDSVGMYG